MKRIFGGNRKPETVFQEIKNWFWKSCIIEGKLPFIYYFGKRQSNEYLFYYFIEEK